MSFELGLILFIILGAFGAWLLNDETDEVRSYTKEITPQVCKDKNAPPEQTLDLSDPILNTVPLASDKEMLYWLLRKIGRADLIDAVRDRKANSLPAASKDLLIQVRYKLIAIKEKRHSTDISARYHSCPRCGGSGYIGRYSHVSQVRCFHCNN